MEILTEDYLGDVVSSNWKPAFDAMWADIKNIGGTIKWNTQKMKIASQISMTGENPDMIFEGDGSSQIWIASPSAATAFNIGGFPNFEMSRLMFTGEGTEGAGAPTDAQAVFTLSNNIRNHIHDCKFLGIKGTKIFDILAGNTITFHHCQMSGNSATVIAMTLANSIIIDDCDFFDFAYNSSDPGTYSKSPDGCAWVRIGTPASGIVGTNTTSVKIVNSRFDEASNGAIEIDGYSNVKIEHVKINIQGTGILLKNLDNATVSFLHVGYNHPDSAAVRVENCTNVTLAHLTKDAGQTNPHKVEVDAGSWDEVKLLNSPGFTKIAI